MPLLPEVVRHLLFWLAVAAFAGAQIPLLIAGLHSVGSRADAPRPPRLGVAPELVLALVPALLTAALLAATWRAIFVSP